MPDILESFSQENIVAVAKELANAGIAAFPTETVYGLGADATNDFAVAKVYEIKNRPTFNPLIIHFQNADEAFKHVVSNDIAIRLAEKFWPGALTMVLPRRVESNISLLASAGLATLAVRVPAHSVAQKLIAMVGKPLAAPSANASGKISPTSAAHVAKSLGDKISMILDGGDCKVGIESTVVDISTTTPTILRHGTIVREDLEAAAGVKFSEATEIGIKSPGQLLSHYSPSIPIRLNAISVDADEALISFGDSHIAGAKHTVNLSLSGDLVEAAANLFKVMHQLDSSHYTGIAVVKIPDDGIGRAINDKLRRAAHQNK